MQIVAEIGHTVINAKGDKVEIIDVIHRPNSLTIVEVYNPKGDKFEVGYIGDFSPDSSQVEE